MKQTVSILAIVALLMSFCLSAFAGRQAGPGRKQENVKANAMDQYQVVFKGGETARIEAWSYRGEDIDISVYNSSGTLVDSDMLPDSHPVCTWSPRYTATYTIHLRNCTDNAVDYVITSN